MKKYLIFLLFLLLFAFATATNCSIYIDASGSMFGYVNRGEVKKVVQNISKILSESNIDSEIILFRSTNHGNNEYQKVDINMLSNSSLFMGQETFLDKCFFPNDENEVAIVITDNVADYSNRNITESTKLFYDLLNRDDLFDTIDIMPLKLDFQGWDYSTGFRRYHNGKKGLICYFLHRNQKEDTQSQKDYNTFISKAESMYTVLHIKPVTGDHFEITEQDFNKKDKITFKFELDQTNKNKYYIKYINNKKPIMTTNKVLPLRISFNLKSKYKHLDIDENTEVKLDNLKLRKNNIEFPIEVLRTNITPSVVEKKLGYGSSQSFDCEIYFKPLVESLRDEFVMLIKRDSFIISFDLQIHNRSDKLKLSDDILKEFFTFNINDKDKSLIYTPYDPVNFFNNQSSYINLNISNKGNINDPATCLTMKTQYELLFMFVIGIIIVILALIVWYVYKFLTVKAYSVIIDNEKVLHVKPRETVDTDLFQFKSVNDGLKLTIKSHNYHLGNLAKKEAILKPNMSYEISSYEYEKIIIKINLEG